MGFFSRDFEGLVPSLGALAAQSAHRPHRLDSVTPFQPILAPHWGPRASQNKAKIDKKNSPKIDAKIDAIFEGPVERLWLTLGMFLGPCTLENACLV